MYLAPFTDSYTLGSVIGSPLSGSVEIPVDWDFVGGFPSNKPFAQPVGAHQALYPTLYGDMGSRVDFSYSVEIYLTPLNGIGAPQLISTVQQTTRLFDSTVPGASNLTPYTVAAGDALNSSTLIAQASNLLTVASGTFPSGAQGMLYYRPAGSTGNFQLLGNSPNAQPRSYSADISGLPDGDYEMIFMAVSDGSDGRLPDTLLRREGYAVHISRAGGSSVAQTDLPYDAVSTRPGFAADSSGSYIWSAPQVLNLYSPQSIDAKLADHLVVRVRGAGEANWRTEYPVGRNPATGAFALDLSAYAAGKYDVEIDLYGGNTKLDLLRGSVNLPGAGQQPEFNFGYLSDYKSTLVFHAQPSDTEYMMVSWEQDGTTHYSAIKRGGNGEFAWDTLNDGLIPHPGSSYRYAIKFTAYDAYGRPLSMGAGDITVGDIGNSQVTLTGSERPCIFEFSPTDDGGHPLTNATSLTLFYREAPKNEEDYARPFVEVTLTRDAGGHFFFDATSLPTNVEYEYRYLARDVRGTVLMERESYFLTGTRNNPVTNVDIVGVIDQTAKDMTIDRMQSHDAFGEVSAERDGRGNWTYLSYNTMGMLTLKREPLVKVTLANGAQIDLAPLTTFYYDLTGNLVGQKDANGNLSTQQWNYGLAQPGVAKSWDAMGYSKVFQHDVRGDLRVSTDELNRRTDYTYDGEHRLIEIARPVLANGQRSVDRYEYDTLGNRIAHTDALGGRERTYYDADGRIIRTVSAAGRTVQYDYRWASSIGSLGTATAGGWIRTTTDANGRSMVDETDLFGRLTKHTDLGGHVFRYTYNWAGLLTKQEGSSGQNVDYTYYSHGLVRSIVDNATKTQSLYEYDGDGNRTAEYFQSFGDVYTFAQSTVEYDALNRVVAIRDDSYKVSYEYDAVGNRRRMLAEYTDMVGYHAKTQEYWYEYDALNRFTVSMGTLSGARATSPDDRSVSIVIGAAGGDGVQLGYNAAGERVLAVYALDGRTERYEYDANGYLSTQRVNGVVVQQRTNDRLGRVTAVVERDARTGQVVTNATRNWDADSLMTSEHDSVEGRTTTYTRMADGTLAKVATNPDQTGGTTVTTTYTYEWWDAAKQKSVVSQGSNPAVRDWKPASSYFNYDANGNLKAAYDDGGGAPGAARAFRYWTDLRGQVQRRDELVGVSVDANGTITGATGDRKHNYYYLNGNRVGNQGNDGTDKVDYVQELAGKLGKGSESQYKVFTPVGSADFDENFMAISGVYPAVSPGQWTVRQGDTLQSVASALWGDSTLWYVLAEANGLKGDDVLKAGQVLTVPNRVTNVHNTASTFKPYDPGRAIGNTQPTLPDPPPPPSAGGSGCGGIAMIVAVVITAIVTAVTYGATSELLYAELGTTAAAAGTATSVGVGVAAGVTAGAAGAAAGQGVMMSAGQQNGFNWNGLAQGALTGALTGGFAASGVGKALADAMGGLGEAGSQIGAQAVLGAGRSALTQGLGIATGLSHGFDWKGVAASAIASGAGYGVGQTAVGKIPVVGGVASGVAAGAASTLARGGSLGRNVGAITADAIASTVGNLVVNQVQAQSVGKTAVSGNGSMSALYGSGGSYEELVRQTAQASYGANAGDQFAWLANSQFTPGASAYGSAVSTMNLTPADERLLTLVDNGRSIVGSSISPDVIGKAVPYPPISVSVLPGGTPGSIGAAPGLFDGLGNIANAYWNGAIGLGDALEMGAGQIREVFHPKDAVLNAATDVSAWGVHQGGILGGAALYGGALVGGVADGMLPNSKAEAVFSVAGGAVAGKLIGPMIGGLEGLAARSVYTSWLAEDAGSVAGRVGTSVAQTADEMIGSAADKFGFRMAIVENGPASTAPTFLSGAQFAELAPSGLINPRTIRFSQDNASANFRPPYGSVNEFVEGLKSGAIEATSIDPVRLVELNNKVFTLDNRRLYSFQQAGVDVPYQKLDSIPKRELFKFTTQNDGVSLVIRGGNNGR
ncbi:LysM peptidoglycan-binding domain-containing protein [Paraburkholderia phenazinium]|uniref:LysM peptidoglycan-binding domain-containing protein n=1 Tax=Paraburkholderia phenazinium TaxID=60549 RepID=UPI00115F9A85|nr:LysM peptidoglycan-binding domain-containing protein [Paraburkholderia phenazinium]